MANQKIMLFQITSKNNLETILNNLVSQNKHILQVIPTITNGFGIVTQGVIIYKNRFSIFNR